MDCLAGQTDQEMTSSNTIQLKNNVILAKDNASGDKIPQESLEHCKIWRMCPAKQSDACFAVTIRTQAPLRFACVFFPFLALHVGTLPRTSSNKSNKNNVYQDERSLCLFLFTAIDVQTFSYRYVLV